MIFFVNIKFKFLNLKINKKINNKLIINNKKIKK